MSDDPLRDWLLSEARRRETWTLEGNREFWAKLSFVPSDGFVHYGGDSMTGAEDFRRKLDEEETYLLLRRHVLARIEVAGQRELDAWLLAWLQRNGDML
ncbi:MAG TPA: hypothetical protein VF765_08195 [Polyangiaceae bacterium]